MRSKGNLNVEKSLNWLALERPFPFYVRLSSENRIRIVAKYEFKYNYQLEKLVTR